MSLVTTTQVRAVIQTTLSDEQLQSLIEREEAEIITRFGEHYVDASTTVVETLAGDGLRSLYLRRRIAQVTAITVDGVELSATDYRVWGGQGRIERLPMGSSWGFSRTLTELVQVTYVPYNDNAVRAGIVLDLVRIALSRTGLKSESIAGEYSYTAEDWDVVRARILNRLSMD